MATTGETASGSAGVQGTLWGARARDFTTVEPKMIALYESVGYRPLARHPAAHATGDVVYFRSL